MKQGILLLNMGGPNNLKEVRLFLKNMFNDPNIITVKSSLLRRFIAYMITTFRTKEAQKNYKKLGGKSPIIKYTKALTQSLKKEMPDFHVEFAMCYTPPFVDNAIKIFQKNNIKNLIIIPLYPHYSTTTVKSSLEDFYAKMKMYDAQFEFQIAKIFYKNKTYNELLIKLLQEALESESSCEYDLIFSAHSLPQKIIEKGDPYQKQIEHHVQILTQLLKEKNINFNKIHLAYQSKLGPVKWLEPELGEKLKTIQNKKVLISPLSFTIDNSETEFELSIEYKEVADKLNYEKYKVAKCPNDSKEFVSMIASLCR